MLINNLQLTKNNYVTEIQALKIVEAHYFRLLRKIRKANYKCKSSIVKRAVLDLIKLDIQDKSFIWQKLEKSLEDNAYSDITTNTHNT